MTTQQPILQASDYEAVAQSILDPAVYAYIAGAAGHEKTMHANRQAFDQLKLKQRAFADFSLGTTQTKLLNKTFRHPILLAPVAAQSLVHPDGEMATAQAADALEAGLILSTRTSKPMASVASAIQSNKWFQLYFQANRETSLNLVKQAEEHGFEAIVVTLDSPIQSLSIRAQAAGFSLPDSAKPVMLPAAHSERQISLTAADSVIFQGVMQEAPTLDDMTWLIDQTNLPVLVKGVMCTAEIDKLRELGVQGLVVSNHGGRSLDSMPDSLSLLSTIRTHVGKDYPILFDSGVRSGSDVFKAIALGADAVCIGRLQIYALAVNGAHGVARLLKLLRDELELCMALTGCPTIADINQDCLFTKD